jgi:hypothetical protein
MPEFHLGYLPEILFHGTLYPDALSGPCLPASETRLWGRVPWATYDNDFQEARMAYANVVWEGLGLRERGRPNAPEWANGIRTFEQLGLMVGTLFVTDDPARAQTLYGPTIEIDMNHPSILDVVEDPNAMTHSAWILILKVGEPLPLLAPAVTPNP